MSVYRPQPRAAHWIGFWLLLVCGGPMIALLLGLALHGAARLLGWVP